MKQQNKTTDISTVTELNNYLKQLNSSVRIGLEDFEDEDPRPAQLDAAVAASTMVVSGSVSRGALVGELKTQLARRTPPAKTPEQLRKEAAWAAPKSGEYIGGGANQPHVHIVSNNEFHLKLGDDRFNIYANATL